MKVRAISVREFALPLVHGYRIAGHSISSVANLVVRIESASRAVGYGCAAPAEEVTGETVESCRDALQGPVSDYLEDAIVTRDPTALCLGLADAAPAAPAACAAADMALWDLAAKSADMPLVELFGGTRGPLPTSVTIGICDVEQTIGEARRWLDMGFTKLKVKTGEDVAADIHRLAALRAAVGMHCDLRVDANQGYDLHDAIHFLDATRELGLELFEQPVAREDLRGAAALEQVSRIPLIADEAVVSIADAGRVIAARAASGINIKLMKCGGLSAARIIHDRATAAGMCLMLGCNDESRISIAAALHFACAMPGVSYVDLDGHMDLEEDPGDGGFVTKDGCLHLTDRPGLGVAVDW